MSLKLIFDALSGQFDREIKKIYAPLANASTAAIKETAADMRDRGRAILAAAGFTSRQWQKGWVVSVRPRRGTSIDSIAHAYHKLGFAVIFEAGARIKGKPLLWLPLPNVPQKIGAKRMTPKTYIEQIGPLHSLRVGPGKPPLLGGYALAGIRRLGKITVAKLRAGSGRGRRPARHGGRVSVPVFVGVPAVNIGRHFNLNRMVDAAAARLPGVYLRQLARQGKI